jgi:nitrogen-specific signal transduction histidine kinase
MTRKEIVHELANQLTVIRGTAELLHRQVAADEESERDVRSLIQATDASIQLVKDLSSHLRTAPRHGCRRPRAAA